MEDHSEQPRKISPDQVEVLSPNGDAIATGQKHAAGGPFGVGGPFSGGVKVFRGGPLTLLALPLLIPIFLVGFILLMFAALLFGRTVFKVIKFRK